MRKYFCLISVLLLSIFFAHAQAGKVRISGTLIHFTNQEELNDASEYGELLPPSQERIIVPDANGAFTLQFTINEPNYFHLGRNLLYLSPGDNIQMVIDYDDPMKASFSGKGSAANNYLRGTPFAHAGSFLDAGRELKSSPRETIDTLEALIADRKKMLDTLTGVSAAFKKLEYAHLKADAINSYNDVPVYHRIYTRDTSSAFKNEWEKLERPFIEKYSKNLVAASFMKIGVYRDIARELIKKAGPSQDVKVIKDWYKASGIIEKMNETNDKQQLKTYRQRINEISTPGYRAAVNKTLTSLLAFGRGDEAADFTAKDINGNDVKLSSLKGKILYVDIWATWCGPCMNEMPHFEALKEKYKDDPSVAFVSLSIDGDDKAWQKSVETRKASGYQWLISRSKLNAYNIVGIPRTLLIDKAFKIVDLNAAMPSSKEIDNSIKALE